MAIVRRKRKSAPKVNVGLRVRPDILESLRQGAAYHNIGYQTYMQWLVEQGLKNEARYYGWATLHKRTILKKKPSKLQEKEIQQLVRAAERAIKK